jgi:hypothetical protein
MLNGLTKILKTKSGFDHPAVKESSDCQSQSINSPVGSIPTSSDTVESEGRQMTQGIYKNPATVQQTTFACPDNFVHKDTPSTATEKNHLHLA